MTLTVRPMTQDDTAACAEILNHIIALGGTTAHETPYSAQELNEYYRQDPAISLVACDGDRIVGFQALFAQDDGVYSIGSFADQRDPVKGVGKALFNATIVAARAVGGTSIIAKITEDNTGGLAYYSRMGFVDDAVWKADHTRPDGTKVDRIVKRFPL